MMLSNCRACGADQPQVNLRLAVPGDHTVGFLCLDEEACAARMHANLERAFPSVELAQQAVISEARDRLTDAQRALQLAIDAVDAADAQLLRLGRNLRQPAAPAAEPPTPKEALVVRPGDTLIVQFATTDGNAIQRTVQRLRRELPEGARVVPLAAERMAVIRYAPDEN